MSEVAVIDDRWIRSVRHHIEQIRDDIKAKALQEFAYELSLMASEEAQGRPEPCAVGSSGCHRAGAFVALDRAAQAARARADELVAGHSRTLPDETGQPRIVADGTVRNGGAR
jgi:hypothetical protein